MHTYIATIYPVALHIFDDDDDYCGLIETATSNGLSYITEKDGYDRNHG